MAHFFFRTAHRAKLKHISEWHMFHNGTQCQAETYFRMAQVSERHVTRTFTTKHILPLVELKSPHPGGNFRDTVKIFVIRIPRKLFNELKEVLCQDSPQGILSKSVCYSACSFLKNKKPLSLFPLFQL